MSFFSRLFAKLFGRKERKEEAPRVPYTPTVDRPPYTPTGKFQPPEVTVPEHPRIPAITEPVPVPKPSPWPQGAYEYPAIGSGFWYVPDKHGYARGPFQSPQELLDYIKRSEVRDENLEQWRKEFESRIHVGTFNPVDIMRSPEESAFCYAASSVYFNKHVKPDGPVPRSFWFDSGLFAGNANSINGLINYGELKFIETHKSADAVVADFPAKQSELYWRVMAVVEGK